MKYNIILGEHIVWKMALEKRDYIFVYLFWVIWSMYSSDNTKTLEKLAKSYDKDSVFF